MCPKAKNRRFVWRFANVLHKGCHGGVRWMHLFFQSVGCFASSGSASVTTRSSSLGKKLRYIGLGLTPLVVSCVMAPDAKAFTPITVIDNIGTSSFPDATNSRAISNTNWLAHSFRTPVTSVPYLLRSLRLALTASGATPVSRTFNIGLYQATNSGTPAVTGGGFRPFGTPLATASYTANFNQNGNFSTGGGYTTFGAGELGSLFNFSLVPNTNYSFVFSSANTDVIGVRSMGTTYTESQGFDALNNTGTSSGLSLSPLAITGSWNNSVQANVQTFGLTVGVDVPGPLPALGAAAAFGYSRRLRRRIQQQF
jgi:hypothetical protein